jgi:riboflavin synthase
MFTGIVTALGTMRGIDPIGDGKDMRLVISSPWPDTALIPLGASIACSGCCLTVVEVNVDSFSVDASAETVARTTLGSWKVGSQVNLERSLRVGDELGGHMVSGHIDDVGEVMSVTPENGSTRLQIQVAKALARFIALKGSITVNGVSLTVNELKGDIFSVNVIPYTAAVTEFGSMKPGDPVNVEVDMIARYVARLLEME